MDVPRRLRIAILTGRFPSVSETFVLDHALGLLARGHDVEVFPEYPGEHPLEPDAARHLAERVHPALPLARSRARRLARAARLVVRAGARGAPTLLRAASPRRFGRAGASLALLHRAAPCLDRPPFDVVHAHHGPTAMGAVALRRLGLLRAPLVVSFHGHDVNVFPRRKGSGVYAELFREAALLVANSADTRSRIVQLGAPSGRIAVIPCGVEPASFAAPRRGHRRAEALRLVTVARLAPEKGLHVALEAVARLAESHPGLRYEIAGEGPERPRLEALAARLGIAARVRLPGALLPAQVRALLAEADLFCLPSVPGPDGACETQGLALVEAQAAGLPVVASELGGLPESLDPGRSGALVPPGDAAALATALDGLARDPARRAAMGAAGRRFVRERFDRTRLLAELEARYVELARAGRNASAAPPLTDASPHALPSTSPTRASAAPWPGGPSLPDPAG